MITTLVKENLKPELLSCRRAWYSQPTYNFRIYSIIRGMTFTFHKAWLTMVKLSSCQLQEHWKSWCFAKLLDCLFGYFSVQCNGLHFKQKKEQEMSTQNYR